MKSQTLAASIYIFKTHLNIMKFRVLIEQDEDGIFVASIPELPGCISQGKTRGEAINNIKDAVEGYLVSLKKHNEPIPPSIKFSSSQFPQPPWEGKA
jgi:antitoxin HicB